MKKILIVLFSCFCCCVPKNISGMVIDDNGVGLSKIEVVARTGDSQISRKTNENGEYSLQVPPGFTGIVNPIIALVLAQINPSFRSYTNVQTDQSNQNFIATQLLVTLSGKICAGDGSVVSGVTVVADGNAGGSAFSTQTTTDANGNYSLVVPWGFTGTTTPSKAGYSFQAGNACP